MNRFFVFANLKVRDVAVVETSVLQQRLPGFNQGGYNLVCDEKGYATRPEAETAAKAYTAENNLTFR